MQWMKARKIDPNQTEIWHNVLQEIHLSVILLAIVHPDSNQTIFSHWAEISIQQDCGSVL